MPRSINGTPLICRHFQGVAMLAAAAAVASGLMSGCSAGQKTQTDSMVAAVPGANADSATHRIALRNVMVVHNPGGYPRGGTAPLAVRIFNNHPDRTVTLTKVQSDAGTVVLVGSSAPPSSAPPSSAPPSSAPPSSAPSTVPPRATGPAPRASVRASGSASAAPAIAAPTTTAATTMGSTAIAVQVPATGYVPLAPEVGRYLAITGLTRELAPGSAAKLTFTFDDGSAIEINVSMSPPASPDTRSPLTFEGPGEAR